MGDILGIGTTHYPPGLVPDEYKPWPLARMLHNDPRIPAHLKDPANWPEPMRVEWGNDEGVAAFKAHRERVFSAFRTLRDEIAAFRPDFILMWGDDQYENFQDDVIPPFCVLAYDTLTFQPFKRLDSARRGSGSARAVAAPLLRARASDRSHLAREPLARGADGIVELVARVPDREESLSLPRSGG